MAAKLMPGLERRLKAELTGEVRFDAFARGRYATDASHYQMMPVGVVAPRSVAEAERALALARDEGASVLARGGGTSQAGQTVNHSLVIDCSRHLKKILELDVAGRRCLVQPGIVLDDLNRDLKPHGLWFPVDISTSSRATIGGMVGNNSCGARSLRYGNTRENVIAVEAVLADGAKARFGPTAPDLSDIPDSSPLKPLARDLLALGAREAEEVAARFPKVQRRVGGYNLDALIPLVARSDAKPGATFADRAPAGRNDLNLGHILVGSEGTLGFSTQIELKLSPLLGRRAVGACHFGSFYEAMNAAQHIVKLAPIAVELIDRTMIELARDIAMFRPTLEQFVRGAPEAILLVEFGEDDHVENLRRLQRLHELIGDLGFAWDKSAAQWGGVVDVLDPALQTAIADVRTSGLNIMMSMKEARKPVSFVEDCAVPLEHLAEYTQRLTDIFAKHGTRGTWYAHASVGCLHVRPVLNLRLDKDVRAMRAIAEEAFAMVRAYKGSHSGEHGDGLVRSEFHEQMFGARLTRAFEELKDRFDPQGLFNPGKIVRAPKFDDRSNFRYGPDYRGVELQTRLDWSAYPGAGGGFQGAVEMCNNNGACRKSAGGVMCPSYRVSRDEKDVTRGRANALRLAITGQLGPDALTSDDMAETMKLCVSCKACRRECPTGVDMARMKIEVDAARIARHGLSLHDRLVAYLPRYAPYAAKWPWLANLRDAMPGAAKLSEAVTGFSARRGLPKWRSDVFRDSDSSSWPGLSRPSTSSFSEMQQDVDARHKAGHDGGESVRELVLFADTFSRYFERENLDAAFTVLHACGYRVHIAQPVGDERRPLCCGRTFLSVGMVDEARYEAGRSVAALQRYAEAGIPIIGLEPSCILGFRDDVPALLKSEATRQLAVHTFTFEEFLVREAAEGRLNLPLASLPKRALVHGHCHQKAFDAFAPVSSVLKLIPELEVETIESSCCGMAGSFGYAADTIDVSLAMGELSLFPAVREADADTIIVADGTSCRQQIRHGSGREALHVARLLAMSVAAKREDRQWN
jgi:FAD/FMN-containing dehydrogenase/Fe-S oxidoreductase